MREALINGRISLPNAVTVFDTGDDEGTLFITMELVEGEDLARRLRRLGPLPTDEAVAVADQVLAVLEVAHGNGIIHRDVKPSNILLQDDGVALLADFGIARPLDELTSGLTKTGQVIATAKYLSPEQAAGQPPTPATDLYSTGIVLYEMLTGTAPFEGGHAVVVALAHQQRPVPPLRANARHVDADLAAVVERALAKDLSDRYASAASMRAALEQGPAAPTAVARNPASTTSIVLADGRHTTSPASEVVDATALRPGVVGASSAPRSEPPWFRRRLALVAALTLAAVIALIAVAALAGDDTTPDDVATGSEVTDSTVSEPPATDNTAPDTTAASPSTAAVMTLGELADRLAADPDSFGEKGSDLLNKPQEVQREKPEKQAEMASRALEEIEKGPPKATRRQHRQRCKSRPPADRRLPTRADGSVPERAPIAAGTPPGMCRSGSIGSGAPERRPESVFTIGLLVFAGNGTSWTIAVSRGRPAPGDVSCERADR